MKKTFTAALTLLLFSCNGDLERFVREGGGKIVDAITAPASNDSDYKFKISPGKGNAVGATLSARTVVSPTARASVGTTIGARVSLSQNRLK